MSNPNIPQSETVERRSFFGRIVSTLMGIGLVASYGTFFVQAIRFLFPNATERQWQYVANIDSLRLGSALPFVTPSGAKVVVAKQAEGLKAENFIALSSVCPHLGCAVHWEPQNNRFFCPCHNGAFDASGKAIAGPPAAAKQELTRYPLRVENGLLYISLPANSLEIS